MSKVIAQISTHKAVKNGNVIEIWLKGLVIPVGYKYPNGEVNTEHFELKGELLYTIPAENEDDVFAIMERYEEDNRCNLNDLNNEL
jgi:hypothetical protein